MKFCILCFFILITTAFASAQTLPGDSILAAERSIDRPVTLHARQIRMTAGYSLDLLSRRYDVYSKSISLKDEGASSVRHRLIADIKYGLKEWVQINAAIAYGANVLEKETTYIYPDGPDPVVAHDVEERYSGFEDLYIGLDLRAPLKTRKFDVAITLGASLPVAPYEPPLPRHSFQATQEEGVAMHRYVYRYTYPRGDGVPAMRLGAVAKYRMHRWAFWGRIDYRHGLKDGKNFDWQHQLNSDGSFDYRKEMFAYRLPDAFTYLAETEYQPRRWLDVFINLSGHVAYRGWISPQEDLKVAVPYQTSWVVTPGAEILITPRFWLRQRISFSVFGRSYEAPLSFETMLMYNAFPLD